MHCTSPSLFVEFFLLLFKNWHIFSESSGHNKFGSDGGHSRGLSEDGEPYVAICDHLASTLDELMFLKGEQIFVIDKMSDTMWKVCDFFAFFPPV